MCWVTRDLVFDLGFYYDKIFCILDLKPFCYFHVVKLLNEAMNKVRIDERKEHAELKNHKYTLFLH